MVLMQRQLPGQRRDVTWFLSERVADEFHWFTAGEKFECRDRCWMKSPVTRRMCVHDHTTSQGRTWGWTTNNESIPANGDDRFTQTELDPASIAWGELLRIQ
jgi:hypothetical protein